jgi:hypothetical protein
MVEFEIDPASKIEGVTKTEDAPSMLARAWIGDNEKLVVEIDMKSLDDDSLDESLLEALRDGIKPLIRDRYDIDVPELPALPTHDL